MAERNPFWPSCITSACLIGSRAVLPLLRISDENENLLPPASTGAFVPPADMSLVARVMFVAAIPCLCRGAAPTQQVYLKAGDRSAWDGFGSAVAVSGNLAVVGAPKENSAARGVNGDALNDRALGSGAAYVFARQDGIWVQQAYLKASNTGDNDGFGSAVAISGETIVIGAMQEDSAAGGINGNQADNTISAAGAVYVFVKENGVWVQQAYLKAAHPGAWDLFGSAVAITGETIVVGANREDSAATGVNGNSADQSASRSGAAYVFTRSGSNWSQQAYLKASDTAANAEFGSTVAISGDVIAVGAPLAAGYAGAVYCFRRSGSTWNPEARLNASNVAGARFGFAVSLSGNLLAIGARGDASAATGINGNQADTSAAEAGAVYVFSNSGSTWSQEAYLKASNTGSGDCFGESVALDGDRLMVGAWGEDSVATGVDGNAASNSAESAGAAYFFSRTGTGWQQDAYLKASNSEAGDWFGAAVAMAGDIALIGAERESGSGAGPYAMQNGNGAQCSGAVYGFALPSAIPEIMVEAAGVPELVDGGALGFAPSAAGMLTMRTLTLRNIGTGPLVLSGWSFSGENAGEFSIDAAAPSAPLAPGEAMILHVQFNGAVPGPHAASLAIASNDPDEGSFDIALSASVESSAALYTAWTLASGLTGEAAEPTATPQGDAVENLLKYAFRMKGSAADTRNLDAGGGSAGLPVCRVVGGSQEFFQLEYLRRKGCGLIYLPKVSADLSADSFVPMTGITTVMDLDAQWERVRIQQPRGVGEAARFATVEVTLP